MSVFLYKKAIKIERNFVKEERAMMMTMRKRNEHTNTQSERKSVLTVSRVGKDAFVTVAAAAADAHLFIKFDELL